MVKPINDVFAVELISKEDKEGLILLSEPSLTYGKVIAVGEGYLGPDGNKVPLTVKVGDIVALDPQYKVSVHAFTTQNLAFLRETQILAIVDEGEML